jgi:hypothetical protein
MYSTQIHKLNDSFIVFCVADRCDRQSQGVLRDHATRQESRYAVNCTVQYSTAVSAFPAPASTLQQARATGQISFHSPPRRSRCNFTSQVGSGAAPCARPSEETRSRATWASRMQKYDPRVLFPKLPRCHLQMHFEREITMRRRSVGVGHRSAPQLWTGSTGPSTQRGRAWPLPSPSPPSPGPATPPTPPRAPR